MTSFYHFIDHVKQHIMNQGFIHMTAQFALADRHRKDSETEKIRDDSQAYTVRSMQQETRALLKMNTPADICQRYRHWDSEKFRCHK